MTSAFFFGYGSLVNRRTHAYENAHPARLSGWRRAWRYTSLRKVSFLTIVRDEDCTLDGLIAEVPGQDWGALDLRERAYDRLHATSQVSHAAPMVGEIAVYAIPDAALNLPDQDHPILLSYVDTVLQGYLQEYGQDGAAQFLATTDGWDVTPILDDRATPVYPRAQLLDDNERDFVDAALRDLGCRVLV